MHVIDSAREFAEKAHAGQLRKYTGEPYIVHPEAVARLVHAVGGDDEMIAAAWLHDVVEDCGVSLQEICDQFGPRIATLVDEVTDVSKPEDGNRAYRKEIDRDHLAFASNEGQTIKLADLIDNTVSITKHDPTFAKVYLAEKRDLLTVLSRGNATLWARAYNISHPSPR